jgi:hypothetical protein
LVNLGRSIQAIIMSPRRRRLTRMLRTKPKRETTGIGRKMPRLVFARVGLEICELFPTCLSVD